MGNAAMAAVGGGNGFPIFLFVLMSMDQVGGFEWPNRELSLIFFDDSSIQGISIRWKLGVAKQGVLRSN